MTQRYKIIAQKAGIKITHYELWFEHGFLWFKRWHPVTQLEFHFDGHSKQVPWRFGDLNDVRDYLQNSQFERTIIEEGEVK